MILQKLKQLWHLVRDTFLNWLEDKPFRQSALIAYFAILGLPGILVISVQVAGSVYSEQQIRSRISGEFGKMIGPDAAQLIENILSSGGSDDSSLFATVIGIATLIYGATGLFYHLQQTLNHIWGVKPEPNKEWLKMIKDRGVSLGLVLIVGLLLLISLVVSAIFSALSDRLAARFSSFLIDTLQITELFISLGFVTVLMALIFKVLPDAKIQWRDVWIGAFVTSVLFVLGKWLLSIYFGNTDPGSTYGAAGSLILIMLWVSYSGLIVFFGAEFTQTYARMKGREIKPSDHATWESRLER